MSNTYNNILIFCTCTGGPETEGEQYSLATGIAEGESERGGALIRERETDKEAYLELEFRRRAFENRRST